METGGALTVTGRVSPQCSTTDIYALTPQDIYEICQEVAAE